MNVIAYEFAKDALILYEQKIVDSKVTIVMMLKQMSSYCDDNYIAVVDDDSDSDADDYGDVGGAS